MNNADKIHIGTSGWYYDHWKGIFYPEDIKKAEMFDYYVDRFETVEINNSFYHLPGEKTFENWREKTGDNFQFAVKGSRYITHMKKLKDPEKSLVKFMDQIEGLGDKLGPVLFQLPASFKINLKRLENFLEKLPKDFVCTFEFRNPSWFESEVYEMLGKYNAAFCIYEIAGQMSPEVVTADYIYVRLHGPGGAYQGSYSPQRLTGLSRKIKRWTDDGKKVYVYFDNDQKAFAVRNALDLRRYTENK